MVLSNKGLLVVCGTTTASYRSTSRCVQKPSAVSATISIEKRMLDLALKYIYDNETTERMMIDWHMHMTRANATAFGRIVSL